MQIVPHGEYYINREKNTYQSPPRRKIISKHTKIKIQKV